MKKFKKHSPFPIPHSPFSRRGFTLVEMIVSLGLFTIVLFIATSAFLQIVNADRKSRAVRIATDNLNLALEDMTRRIKTGSTYYCGTSDTGDNVGDCPEGGSSFYFTNQDGARMGYSWDIDNNAIWRTTGTGAPEQVTSSEIKIDGLKFIVSGSTLGVSGEGTDAKQPTVVIAISGSLGENMPIRIQTMVTQRVYDN